MKRNVNDYQSGYKEFSNASSASCLQNGQRQQDIQMECTICAELWSLKKSQQICSETDGDFDNR